MEWVPDWWWQHDGISFKTDWGTITKTKRAYNSQIINGRMSDEGLLHHTIAFTPDVIQNEPNQQTRRWMLDAYGEVAFFKSVKNLLINESDYGRLWRMVVFKTIDDPLWHDLLWYPHGHNPDVKTVYEYEGKYYDIPIMGRLIARAAYDYCYPGITPYFKIKASFEEMFL
jgi:hypothetical protein